MGWRWLLWWWCEHIILLCMWMVRIIYVLALILNVGFFYTINRYFLVWILRSLPQLLHLLQLQHLQLVDHLNGLVITTVMMITTMKLVAGTEVKQNSKNHLMMFSLDRNITFNFFQVIVVEMMWTHHSVLHANGMYNLRIGPSILRRSLENT